ncbi:MAG TPA: tetratricopeptide repeat protein, partial [Chthoniobacterales bacterium]
MSETEDSPKTARVAAIDDELLEVTARERIMRALGLTMLLVVATIAGYQQIWRAGFVWQDDMSVSANPLLTVVGGLRAVWLHPFAGLSPVAFTFVSLEHALWGTNAVGYHWFSIGLHLVNVLILWRVLRNLELPGAWLAAAMFALHPVEVESVAWVTQQRDLLMGFWSLLALLAWLTFVAGKHRGELKFYFVCLICFLLALGCDPIACLLPFVFLLISWLKRGAISFSRVVQVIPFALLGGIVAGLTWWQARYQLGEGARFATPILERVVLAARDFWFYLAKLLWPTAYPFHYTRWNIAETSAFDYIWVGGLVLLVALILLARRWCRRGPETALVFFALLLAPTLVFVVLGTLRYSFLADHYPYLASIGPLALVAAGVTSALESRQRLKAVLLPLIGMVILAALGFRAWQQARTYASSEALLNEIAAHYPLRWLAHYDVANWLLIRRDVDAALARYQEAIDSYPRNLALRKELADRLVRLGRSGEAVEQYRAVLALDPNSAVANYQLALALLFDGKLDEARQHAEKGVAADPNDTAAQTNYGIILSQLGERDAAVTHFQKALE